MNALMKEVKTRMRRMAVKFLECFVLHHLEVGLRKSYALFFDQMEDLRLGSFYVVDEFIFFSFFFFFFIRV